MSGESHMETCPNCGNEMDCWSDWKPFSTVGGECMNCGFHYWTETGQMTLKDVNELREGLEKRPLKKLAKSKGTVEISENRLPYHIDEMLDRKDLKERERKALKIVKKMLEIKTIAEAI